MKQVINNLLATKRGESFFPIPQIQFFVPIFLQIQRFFFLRCTESSFWAILVSLTRGVKRVISADRAHI